MAAINAFLSPVVNRGIRRPLGELTNTPPQPSKLARQSAEQTPLKEAETPPATLTPSTPFTPMHNLKLLISVAADRAATSGRRELFREDNDENDHDDEEATISLNADHDYSTEHMDIGTPSSLAWSTCSSSSGSYSSAKVSRKDKSLGLLCDKFLARFPMRVAQADRCEIQLDDLARQMNTERRRIYDIVNVLEAIQMMTKVGKNVYAWHGTTHQSMTLAWLRQLAGKLDLRNRYEDVKRLEPEEVVWSPRTDRERDLKRSPALTPVSTASSPSVFATPTSCAGTPTPSPSPAERKTSLGVACQKFLMLFLVVPESDAKINLDLAAKVIHGLGLTEAVMKTRIRRLYDIANILQSLRLIQKVQVADAAGIKKPAFQYIGPNVEAIDLTKDVLSSLPSTRQKHSLLTFGKSLLDLPDEPVECDNSSSRRALNGLFLGHNNDNDDATFAKPALKRTASLLELGDVCHQAILSQQQQLQQQLHSNNRFPSPRSQNVAISLLKRTVSLPVDCSIKKAPITSPLSSPLQFIRLPDTPSPPPARPSDRIVRLVGVGGLGAAKTVIAVVPSGAPQQTQPLALTRKSAAERTLNL